MQRYNDSIQSAQQHLPEAQHSLPTVVVDFVLVVVVVVFLVLVVVVVNVVVGVGVGVAVVVLLCCPLPIIHKLWCDFRLW